jgi:hypothetical protein
MGAKIIHLKKIIRTVQRIVPQISLPQIQKLVLSHSYAPKNSTSPQTLHESPSIMIFVI